MNLYSKRWYIRSILLAVLVITSIALMSRFFHSSTPAPPPRFALQPQPADNILRDKRGTPEGSVRLEKNNTIRKIVFAFTAPSTTATYHGWLLDPEQKEYRYAGMSYPTSDGNYSLIYTTEEDIGRFHQLLISEETHPQPAAPTKLLLVATLP